MHIHGSISNKLLFTLVKPRPSSAPMATNARQTKIVIAIKSFLLRYIAQRRICEITEDTCGQT
jgi:hypothetical protein